MKKHIFLVSLFSTLATGSITCLLIPWAVNTGHGDNGFILLENDRQMKWRKQDFPLSCLAHPSTTQAQLDMYDRARRRINRRVGRVLLSACSYWALNPEIFPRTPIESAISLHVDIPPIPPRGDVFVDTPWDIKAGGMTRLEGRSEDVNAIYGAMIWIHPEYVGRVDVWMHELCHVLGLDHDRIKDSLMWPYAQERANELTDKDVELLRRAYVEE